MSNSKIDIENMVPCQIQHLNLSCFGCCGRNFKSEKLILEELKKNTFEFNKINIKSTLRLLQFRDRFSLNPFAVTKSGLCSNIVEFENGVIACPLHPKINEIVSSKIFNLHKKNLDLRIKHCDVNYQCDTFNKWLNMTLEERKNLVKWIEKQNFNNYNYSNLNGEDKLFEKFKKENL